ncbi:cytochrome c [Schlegelella sp. S2-27]|uniref:Cytochrome c n=1 Tax=Caldimonas mangrovi TaxID=2944811 RepID=A0ABT0YR42_9BURK|nr:cytochrome c [Caldimonas mangrovi]
MQHRWLLTLVLCAPVLAWAGDDEAKFALGKRLFIGGAVPACAVCHTLKDAGSEGAIGPVLDELQPDAARVAQALRTGLGAMPAYGEKLTEVQIDALAYYVSRASGATR